MNMHTLTHTNRAARKRIQRPDTPNYTLQPWITGYLKHCHTSDQLITEKNTRIEKYTESITKKTTDTLVISIS